MGSIKDFIQKNGLQLTMLVATAVIAYFNIIVSSKLAPIAQDMAVLIERVHAVEVEESDHVHTAELNQIVTRIDHISNRVDQIYSLIVQK